MIKVGQTWKTKGGAVVTIIRGSRLGDWYVQRENGAQGYNVANDGKSPYLESYDLGTQMMRAYIAGPMTGHADLNFPAFHAAAKLYRDRGCYVINPAEINGGADEPAQYAAMEPKVQFEHWVTCMKKDIAAVLTCEMIVMLPGWRDSKGASLEYTVASALGLTVTYLDV